MVELWSVRIGRLTVFDWRLEEALLSALRVKRMGAARRAGVTKWWELEEDKQPLPPAVDLGYSAETDRYNEARGTERGTT